MADEVVKTITIRGRADGIDQTTSSVQKLQSASSSLQSALPSLADAWQQQQVALNNLLAIQERERQLLQQLNMAQQATVNSARATEDSFSSFGKGMIDTASDMLTTVSHLKLLGVAAYALSPAFRSVVNTGASEGLALMGANAGLAATTTTRLASVVSPLLRMFGQFSGPIMVIVAAMELLNAAWSQGSTAVEKYTNYWHQFFGSNVDSDLAKLTKFQNDTASFAQIQYASELGNRLDVAKQKIDDFLKVHLDLTDAGLKLQNAWVLIVETIAKGTDQLGRLVTLAQSSPVLSILGSSALHAIPVVGPMIGVAGAANNLLSGSQADTSPDDALNRAKGVLGAGMFQQGLVSKDAVNFASRFTGDISSLAGKNDQAETAKAAAAEFDRLSLSIARTTAVTEANALTEGQSAGEVTRLRTEFRLMEAAQQDIVKNGGDIDDYSDRIAKLATRAGEAAQALARAKLYSDIGFGLQTTFLTPEDTAIAQQLRPVYGNDVSKSLSSTEADVLRMNGYLKTMSSQSFSNLNNSLLDFETGAKKGTDAIKNFEQQFLKSIFSMMNQMIIMKPLAQSLQGVFGLFMPQQGSNGLSTDVAGNGSGIYTGPAWMPGFGHSGAVINSWSSGNKFVHPGYFANAPRMHSGGMIDWAAGERPFVGLQGERVLNRQETKDYGRGPAPVQHNVRIYNYGGGQVDTSTGDDGSLEITMRAIARDEYAGPRTNTIAAQKFGQKPRLKWRA